MEKEGEVKGLVVGLAGRMMRLLVAKGRYEGMSVRRIHHEISPAYTVLCLSPLWFLMKNFKFWFKKKDPTLSVSQRMIWIVIRLITMRILALVAERDLEQ